MVLWASFVRFYIQPLVICKESDHNKSVHVITMRAEGSEIVRVILELSPLVHFSFYQKQACLVFL